MKELTIQQLVEATGGTLYESANSSKMISGVEFDSRRIQPGDLFVPLTGGATDGHTYIQKAIDQGATACLWSNPIEEALVEDLHVIQVEDTLKAFQQLAVFYRDLINPTVIGITGSNGKTTTKDMTAEVLQTRYKVHKTQGNYNNEIGLPYTILTMPEETDIIVLEMGMSGYGEIEELSLIAKPDIAVITLIGESHLEHLGSREGIAKAKLEILKGLKEDGLFIYPQNESLLQNHSKAHSLTFGLSKQSDVYAYDLVEEATQTYFKTNLDTQVVCSIPVLGSYNVTNALIALSIARELDVPMEQAIFKLSQFQLTKNRLEWLETANGAKVLNDAYNASPTSMKAVLKTFSSLPIDNSSRRIVVLGDIRELGAKSKTYHQQLAEWIHPEAIQRVYLFGPEMKVLYEALKDVYSLDTLYYEKENHDRLISELQQEIRSEDMILIKSSFGTDLLQVVTALTGKATV
ncbi:UDP-N-acetylmuramoyl-tripeptide--D-alanyl-D-alanine ligase [Dolosicoccus paucivorans]|uniref:UDP-N-acetylmuramoyl-tripeptide--D-alanyl-D- alanine ligase n=1 Tax=Dolosicoccus paucivorans TaxID=84521 RepID=UPI000880A8BE|nr:UDP-N-acetylmuramoyl-tripeptide--D-alanyl-D-alanine ligase [Dolosicoccus paucivorans]SDI64070.1 UDP-N-acetylmuramoyl-tripeptide--D-alanyl-D-alanine ligase [Dolosicoccus paucivorans]